MKNNKIKGTGTAVVTPFDWQGEVDYNALKRILLHQTHNGIDFLVAMGTTGEAVSLTKEERTKVVDVFKKHRNGLPLVLGIGGNNTEAVVNQINDTDFTDIDAILSVVPYYNKPSQEGIFLHFEAIADASPVPVIIYNVPGRTGKNMDAATTLKLAYKCKKIVAVKEASGDMMQIMNILRNKPAGFSVLSGDDALTYSLLGLGADGVISVVSNAFPALFSDMVQFALDGQNQAALEIHNELLPFVEMIFREGSPSGVKVALKNLGLCEYDNVRLPLAPVSRKLSNEIITFVSETNI